MKRILPLGLMLAALLGFATRAIAGDDDGQADLDKATEKKLSAESLQDLAEVLKLCDSAQKKGLTPANAQFAGDLYTSTLLQRGTIYTQVIFDRRESLEAGLDILRVRDAALADLEKVVARDAKIGSAHLMIAKLRSFPQKLGKILSEADRAKALEAAEQAVALNKEEAQLEAASLVVRADLLQEAAKQEADYNAAIKLAPDDPEALKARGMFYFAQKKFEPSLADFDALSRVDTKDAWVYLARGLVLFSLKRNDEAIRSFDRAIQLRPNWPGPYIQRARIRADQNDTAGALEDLETALKLNPEDVLALLFRARIYQQSGDMAKAKTDLEAALKNGADPNVARELREAVIFSGAGDYVSLIHYLEELLKISPKHPVLLTQIGVLYAADKQSRKAIEEYSAALAEDDKNWAIYAHRGDAYLNIGKHAEAVKDYEAAFAHKPNDADLAENPAWATLLNNYAWVLATSPTDKLRNGKRSIELGTDACKATQYSAASLLSTLAAGYAETGDFETALKWSSKAVEIADKDQSDDEDIRDELKRELDSYKQKKPWRELLDEDENPTAKKKSDKKPDEQAKPSELKKPDSTAQKPTAANDKPLPK